MSIVNDILSTIPSDELCVAIVDLNKEIANYKRIKDAVGNNVTVSAVVKDNAYGMGAIEVSRALYSCGCRDFFVATFKEAISLRQALQDYSVHIYILLGCPVGLESLCSYYQLTPVLNSQQSIDIWYEYTQKCVSGTFTECVLQIDTGLSRNGIAVDETINDKKLLDTMNLKFIMSHLACGDAKDSHKNAEQLNLFKRVVDVFGHNNIKYSLTASACLNLGKEYYFDIVRIGAGIHGFMTYPGLENVVSLYTRILQIRTIHRGDTVGYDCAFTADQDIKVATLAIGFGNGLTKTNSSKYKFFIHNTECKVLGNIAMDCTMIDVSCIEDKYLCEGTWCQCLLNDTYDIVKLSTDLGVNRSEIMTHLKLSRYYIQGNV